MRVAITGGTGFVGRHLAERFPDDDVVIVSRRTGVAVDDVDALAAAFEGCEDLKPRLPFDDERIRAALPEPGGFGLGDVRLFARRRSLTRRSTGTR